MKLMKILSLALIALALTAASASALTQADIAKIAPTARAPWKASHCYGRELVNVVQPSTLPRGDDGWRAQGAAMGVGDPLCRVLISSALTLERACTVLTHEFGHLAGLEHSENRRSVMYWDAPEPRRCWKFSPELKRAGLV